MRRPLYLLLFALCLLPSALRAQQSATPKALVARGDRLLAADSLDAAEEAYEQALDQNDNFTPARIGRGRVALQAQDWSEATGQLSEVLEQNPSDLEAHYWRGIAYRERGRIPTAMERIRGWRAKSEDDFEAVLARDSLFRDVLYQYALLESYRRTYPKAVRLARAQVRLKPELTEPQVGLFQIGRHFVYYRRSRARDWVEQDSSDFARYVRGELLRLEEQTHTRGRDFWVEEKPASADAVFASLLKESSLPRPPLLLRRARTHYAMERDEEAQRFVEQAIAGIDSETDALLVFEDVKYIVSGAELEQFRALRAPEAYRRFFRALWTKRDPMPASPLNQRMAEHYRRLRYAEENFLYPKFRAPFNDPNNDPEKRAPVRLTFPATYELGTDFDDRGIIYIRHGEPHQRERAPMRSAQANRRQPTTLNSVDAVSWQYNNPQMDFHFEVSSTTSTTDEGSRISGVGDWRLVAVPAPVMLDELMHWGDLYFAMARGAGGGYVDEFARRSRAYVEEGLTTDRHTWPDEIEPFDMPHRLAAFRGEDGATELELHYVLPVGRITEAGGETGGTVRAETGYAVYDTTWQPVAEHIETKQQLGSSDASAGAIDLFRFSVPPDSYHVALHSRPLATNLRSGYKFDYRVPDFSDTGLQMSDVLLAYAIAPDRAPSRFSRHGLHIEANPAGRFSRRQPMHVYFEIYGLTFGPSDRTRYTLTYTLTLEERDRGFLSRIGRFFSEGDDDRVALSLETELKGTEASPVEHAALDAGEVDPGRYTLTVQVTDEHTGRTVQQSVPVRLAE